MQGKNSFKLSIAGLLTIAMIATGVYFAPPAHAIVQPLNNWESYFTDTSQVVYVQGSVLLDDIDQETVFNYVANLENDPSWYPGTLSSQLVSGDGGAGTTYQEVVAFGPEPITITATVLGVQPNHRFSFTSDSFLVNVTEYEVRQRPDGKTELIVSSYVQLPPGFSREALVGYLNLVLNTLPGALGTTGTVSIE